MKEEETTKRESTAKYPNARIAFSWFPKVEASWDMNKTQLKAGELLFVRGETRVRAMLDFIREYRNEEFFPEVLIVTKRDTALILLDTFY